MFRRRIGGSEGVESSSMRVGPDVGRDRSFGVGVGNSSLEKRTSNENVPISFEAHQSDVKGIETHPVQLLALPSPTSQRLPSHILSRYSSTNDPNRSDGNVCVDQRPRETEDRE